MNKESEIAYERYLEKYCDKHNISKEEAETHQVVKDVKEHYSNEYYYAVTKEQKNIGCGGA